MHHQVLTSSKYYSLLPFLSLRMPQVARELLLEGCTETVDYEGLSVDPDYRC